jgi:hypothetical protein
MVYCALQVLGLVGSLLMVGGALLGLWVVLAGGMIIIGLSVLPSRKRLPDYVPSWVGRWFVPFFASLWILLGIVVFILSWF